MTHAAIPIVFVMDGCGLLSKVRRLTDDLRIIRMSRPQSPVDGQTESYRFVDLISIKKHTSHPLTPR